MLPVAVARSSGDSAVHYVLPVFADVDDVLFSHNGRNADTDSGVSNIANYLPWQASGAAKLVSVFLYLL